MIKIPQNNQWQQTNDSNINGNLWATQGCDLTGNIGRLRAGDRMILNTNSTDISTLLVPVRFMEFNAGVGYKIWTAAGTSSSFTGGVFVGTISPNGSFSADTKSGSPTAITADSSDMETFIGNLYVTGTGYIYELTSAGTWNSYAIPSDASGASPHMMTTYNNRLYMTAGSGTKIYSAPANGSVLGTIATPTSTYTLQFTDSSQTFITWIRASSSRIWIGTLNPSGNAGYVYEWDGSSALPTASYRLDSAGALACVMKDDTPYIMNTNGEIQVWNGGTFKNLDDAGVGMRARLYRINNQYLYKNLSTLNDRFIHPNGMSIVEGKITILVDTRNYTSGTETEETMPAGIYEYNPLIGLVHKHGLSSMRATDTQFSDSCFTKIARVGALSVMAYPYNSSANGKFLCGAQYFTNASASAYGIFYNDSNRSKPKCGHFITEKVWPLQLYKQPLSVSELWQKVFVNYRQFMGTTERIVVKYRTVEADPTEATITWVDNHTFTSSVTGYTVGDEVEILQGPGAGISSHISAINGTTFTVDEYYYGVGTSTAIARFQKWTKLGSDLTSNTQTSASFAIGKVANWIQFKVWFQFENKDEIEQLITVNTPQVQAV